MTNPERSRKVSLIEHKFLKQKADDESAFMILEKSFSFRSKIEYYFYLPLFS